MSQVRLLSVDIGQSPDIHGSKGDALNKSQANASAFSDAMEQHYPSKKGTESEVKVKPDGNRESKAATQQSQVNNSDGSLKPVKATKADDAVTLPVPLPKDDESLKAKLTDSDDAHTLPMPVPIDDESLMTESTASFDVHILSAPIAHDNEALIVIKASKGDEHTLPVPAPVSPLAAEQRAIEKAGGAFNGDPKVPSKQQYLSLDFQSQAVQAQNDNANNLVNDDAVDLLKMLNGAQQLLTKPVAENTNTEQSTKRNNLATEQVLASDKSTAQSEPSKSLTAEQAVLAKAEQVPMSSTTSDITQSQLLAGISSAGQSSELIDTKQANIQALAQVANAVLENNQDAKQVAGSKEMQNTLASESESTIAKNTLSAELNTENKAFAGEKNNEVKAAEGKQPHIAEFKRASDNDQRQSHTVNQSTASVIAASTVDAKVDVNQKAAMSEDVRKLANNVDDVEKLSKNEREQQALQPEKIASAFNQTLEAQALKPLTSTGELAAKQEQSFESAINSLTTNTVQTQKSITAMNTETIAIYRKDFADAVKDKVMVMINQKIQQVEIQLDPPEMGNIHVRVNLQNEQAAVQFVVQNQQAKDALEQNMGKLRDMLAESGVDVGDASIEQRQAQEQNSNGFDGQANNGESSESSEGLSNENDNSVLNVLKASSTGVDYYA